MCTNLYLGTKRTDGVKLAIHLSTCVRIVLTRIISDYHNKTLFTFTQTVYHTLRSKHVWMKIEDAL